MNKILIGLLIFITLFSISQTSYKNSVQVNSYLTALVGFQDGTCKDYIRGNSGSARHERSQQTDMFGQPYGALEFTQDGDCKFSSSNSVLEVDGSRYMTLTAWVYLKSYGQMIFDNKASTGYYEDGYHWQVNDSGKQVFMAHDDDSNEIYDTWLSTGDYSSRVVSGYTVPKQQWVHIAIVKYNKQVKFYINGEYQDSKYLDEPTIVYDDGSNRYFSDTNDDDEHLYDGHGFMSGHTSNIRFGEFRCYMDNLSSTNIRKIYQWRPPSTCRVAYPGSTWCKSCKGNRQMYSNKSCKCVGNTYETGSTNCATCQPKCATCSSSSSCGSCSNSNFRKMSNSCNCPATHYDPNEGTDRCWRCHDVCNGCTSKYICKSCQSPTTRILGSDKKCACRIGYFQDGYEVVCGKCNFKCSSCQGNKYYCLTCSSTTRNDDTVCNCKNGYYQVGQNLHCTQCSSDLCKTCSGSSGCDSCKDTTTRNDDSICSCQYGYYQVGTNALCTKCPPKCADCDNGSTCSVCGANGDPDNDCQCLPGYFLETDDSCQPCNPVRCSTCQTDRDQCIECSDSSKRDKFDSCNCIDNYFDDGTASCQQCNTPCSKCVDNADKCTDCDPAHNRHLVGNQCLCLDKFWHNGSATCADCDHQCSKCVDRADKCTECSDPNRIDDEVCNCKPGWYEDPTTKACLECDPQCAICSGSADNCGSCEDATKRTNDSNCDCLPGHWDDGNETCEDCNYMCETCDNGTTCQTCKTTTPQRTGTSCDCPYGYYDNNVVKCVKCPHRCADCDNGTSCTVCAVQDIPGHDRIDANDCGCPDGWYDEHNNSQCQQCTFGCTKCSDGHSCSECKVSSPARQQANVCKCPTGWFDDLTNAQCHKCPIGCTSCTALDDCDGCVVSNPVRDVNDVCRCPDTHFDNEVDDDCEACHTVGCVKCRFNGCMSCSTDTTCDLCKTSTNTARLGPSELCACPEGYYEIQGDPQCYQCSRGCKSCSDASSCDECKPSPDAPREFPNKCECPLGSFHVDDQDACSLCYSTCESCTDGTSCDTCLDTSKEVHKKCECYDNEYEHATNGTCQLCMDVCTTCSDGTTCDTCVVSNPPREGSTCSCPDGWWDNGTDAQCQKCRNGCVTCDDDLSCTGSTCQVSTPARTGSLCQCPTIGFYDDGVNAQCAPCHHKCLACSGAADSCLHCSHPTRDINCECTGDFWEKGVAACQEGCPDGQYHIGNFECADCIGKCETCENTKDECLRCAIGIKRFNNPPDCICDDGYYDDGVDPNCQPCNANCALCNNGKTCTKCHNIFLQPPNCTPSRFSFWEVGIQENDQPVNTEEICQAKCKTCQSNGQDQCLECAAGLNRSNLIPDCDCLGGYYNDIRYSDCQKCPEICLTCSDKNSCLTCTGGRQVNDFTNLCECSSGYLWNEADKECVICFEYNGDCFSKCPRGTKPNTKYQTCVLYNYQSTSESTIYMMSGAVIAIVLLLSLLIFMKQLSSSKNKLLAQKITEQKVYPEGYQNNKENAIDEVDLDKDDDDYCISSENNSNFTQTNVRKDSNLSNTDLIQPQDSDRQSNISSSIVPSQVENYGQPKRRQRRGQKRNVFADQFQNPSQISSPGVD